MRRLAPTSCGGADRGSVSAYVTEIIGIHAIFGAFISGAIMPRPSAADLTRSDRCARRPPRRLGFAGRQVVQTGMALIGVLVAFDPQNCFEPWAFNVQRGPWLVY